MISPETELLFRDGGRAGDSFCEEVVRGAASHLAPDGFATALVNWVVPDAEPWSAAAERWVRGQGCDAWLLRMDTKDTLSYAASWNRQPDAARYAAALDRWLAYYDAHGIRAISMGAVILRKRATGVAWLRAQDLPAAPRADASAALLQVFATQDRLSELGEREALLGARFRASEALRLTQVATMREGRFDTGPTGLALDGALPFEGTADAGALRVLQLCDGRRTLGEIASLVGGAPGGASERLVDSIAEAARQLVTLGFLVPVALTGEGGSDASANESQPAADAAAPRGVGGGRARGARRRAPRVGAR